ncbi:MAG TPA: CdaR family protein [Vicinamibacterales bacterium]|nr:CdaR family protein [Vicinamibacterales bacterium]
MIRLWPFRNLGLKLLSVGIGTLLWISVSGEETVERGLRAPLELQQFPQGLEIQGEAPSTVDVRVRGTTGALSRVGAGDIVAVLDLRGVRPGSRLFAMTPEQVRSPFGVEVVQVTPSTIALSLENSLTRSVPVLPSVEGSPAPGFVVAGRPILVPDHVDIVGPETAVKRATEAVTETVSVEGLHDTMRQDVTVGLIDPALRLRTQRTVNVTVKIVPGPMERTVRGRPIRLRNLGERLSAQATPPVVDVGLRGSRDVINKVQSDDVHAYVDLGGLGEGEYTLVVHTDMPDHAGVTRVDPAMVQVRITSVKN